MLALVVLLVLAAVAGTVFAGVYAKSFDQARKQQRGKGYHGKNVMSGWTLLLIMLPESSFFVELSFG